MENTNLNNSKSWQTRVKELEHIEGEEPFDTAASWEKFQMRRVPVKKKSAVWMYAAAAVLLLMIMIPIALKDEDEVEVAGMNVSVKDNGSKSKVRDTVYKVYKDYKGLTPVDNLTQVKNNKKVNGDKIVKDNPNLPTVVVNNSENNLNLNLNLKNNLNLNLQPDLLAVAIPKDSPSQITKRALKSYTIAEPKFSTINVRQLDPVLGQDRDPDNDIRRIIRRRTETTASSGPPREYILNNQN